MAGNNNTQKLLWNYYSQKFLDFWKIALCGINEYKGDFVMKLVCFVGAGNCTGFLALVKRAIDGIEKYCLGPLHLCTFTMLNFNYFCIFCTHLHICSPTPTLFGNLWPTSTHTRLSLAGLTQSRSVTSLALLMLTLSSQSLPDPILALLKGFNEAGPLAQMHM